MSCKYVTPRSQVSQQTHTWFHINKSPGVQSRSELIIPDCTPGLMYIRSGAFSRISQSGEEKFTQGNVFLFGQKCRSVVYEFADSGLEAYGVKLPPASLYSLFGISAGDIADRSVNMHHVVEDVDKIALDLQHNTFTGGALDNCIPDLLRSILHSLHLSDGIGSIGNLLDKVGVSYKKTERLFRKHVGVTPKMYARILRFNYSLRLGGKIVPRLTDLAYQSGYFDQNHFIKEVKYFTGRLPSEIYTPDSAVLEPNQISYITSRNF